MENYNIKINDYPAEYGEIEYEPLIDRDKDLYDDGYRKGKEAGWKLCLKLLSLSDSETLDIFQNYFDYDFCDETPIYNARTIIDNFDAIIAEEKIEEYKVEEKCKKCAWYKSQGAQWPTGCPCDSCTKNCNFSEKKYPEYHVGDEIEDKKIVAIITKVVSQTYVNILYSHKDNSIKGAVGYVNPRNYTKTGKTYPDIEKIINELGR